MSRRRIVLGWLAVLLVHLSATAVFAGVTSLNLSSEPGDFVGRGQELDGAGTLGWATGFDQAGVTSLLLESEPGDPVGHGRRVFLTRAEATFGAARNPRNGVSVGIASRTGGPSCTASFAAPFDAPLTAGSYPDARDYLSSQDPSRPGLNVVCFGVTCGSVTGSFEVKEIAYGSGSRIGAFRATFEQHCGGEAAALRGEVRFRVDVPILVKGPTRISGSELQELSFEVAGIDIHGGPIVLGASGLPEGASLTDHGDNTATFRWTPGRGQAGAHIVDLHAQDAFGETDRALIAISVAPANDDFDNATLITTLPFEDSVDMSDATRAADDPFCLQDAPTAWYAFTPTDNMTIEITTPSSTFPPAVGVFTGVRGALTRLACASLQPITLTVERGLTYYIMLTGSGRVGLSVAALSPPANDDIGNAISIVHLPFLGYLDTRAATTAPGDPYCFGRDATVWYRLYVPQIPVPFEITLSTGGSDYEATVSAYAGYPGALTQVACGLSQVTFTGRGYETFYLMVGSAPGSAGGQLALSVTAIPSLFIDLSVDSTARLVPRTSLATITGKVYCTHPVLVRLDGMLSQTAPGGTTGRFVTDRSCTGLTSWSVTVGPFEYGRFLPGSAELSILATASDPESGETAEDRFSGTVTLRVRRIIYGRSGEASHILPRADP